MEQTVGIGILSFAHTGHAVGYARALQRLDGVELVAIYDEDAQRGRAFAERFGVTAPTDEVDDLLTRNDIDAVIICCPTDTHADLAIAAARANKHILCEKPIATRLDDAQAMIAAREQAGVQLHLSFPIRFMPVVQKVKQSIAAGEIGEIVSMVGGNRGIPPLPPAYPTWITDQARAGGGAVMDHSVHVTDAMRYLSQKEAISVSAEVGTLFRTELTVDDAGLLLVQFADDVAASIDPSWAIPMTHPYHYDFFLRILGTDGMITIDETRQSLQVTRTRTTGEGRGFTLEPFGVEADLELVRHFVRCVREGEFQAPAASGEDGLRALEIALAAYESAASGQPVHVRELRQIAG